MEKTQELGIKEIIKRNNQLTGEINRDLRKINDERLFKIIGRKNYEKLYGLVGEHCDNYAQFLCDAVYRLETLATEREFACIKFPEKDNQTTNYTKNLRKLKKRFIREHKRLERHQRIGIMPTKLDSFYDEIEIMLEDEYY